MKRWTQCDCNGAQGMELLERQAMTDNGPLGAIQSATLRMQLHSEMNLQIVG